MQIKDRPRRRSAELSPTAVADWEQVALSQCNSEGETKLLPKNTKPLAFVGFKKEEAA